MIFDGVELPALLTLDQAACVLKVDVSTLEGWIVQGKVDVVRVNGRTRVLSSSIADRMGHRTDSRSNREAQS